MKRKIILALSTIFIITSIVLFIVFLMKGDSSRWQVALGGIVVSALPYLLLRLKKIPFNIPLIVGYYLTILCTTFLGSIAKFYLKHKWWDSTLHLYKGFYVAFIGITLYKICIPETVRKDVSRWMIFLFVLSLSVTSSVLWEIYEFFGDLWFTHTMQLGGNKDTMYDLLSGFAGGVIASIYATIRKPNV
ncbi:membrane-spanning protein [Bacillus massilinigeriensis]|uniref:membrane-spanning protein n=1 Tax=Bacillus massilionigeriensis TaxID=1805475 RepID=UPI00096AEA3C|nr:membrane-spanning protein [Bacillus massilionigeriensis]